MHAAQIKKVVVGTHVHCILYGGKDGIIVAIHGEQRPETGRIIGNGIGVAGGNAHMDVVWNNGTRSNAVPEMILRGVQWRIYHDQVASQEEIAEALALAEYKATEDEIKRKIAAQEREAARERIKAENPHLHQAGEHGHGGKHVAKNVRIELKRAFPKVKFSVKSDYNSVDIGWSDGPTDKAVESLVSKYQAGHFNSMEDGYDYHPSAWNDVFGGVRYVFTHRSFSPALIDQAISAVFTEYAGNLAGVERPSAEDYKSGQLRLVNVPAIHWTLQDLIYQAAIKIEG